MIDEKKIQEESYEITDGTLVEDVLRRAAFVYGAHWAQKEFVKSLWHPAKEEPKEKGYIITKWWVDSLNDTYYECDNIQDRVKWKEYIKDHQIMEWCYLSDILPTEKGDEKRKEENKQ